jgi:hypothetical protein
VTFQLTDSLKNQLFIFLVFSALAIATPQFDTFAEADVNGGTFFVLEGRGSLSEGDSTVWLEEVTNAGGTFPVASTGRIADIDTDFARFSGRLGGGYRNGAWDFGVFYSGLQALDDEKFVPQSFSGLGFGGAQVLANSILAIGTYNATVPILLEASASVTYTVIDVEAGFNFNLGPVDARLFGGVRYASFDQDVYTLMVINAIRGNEHRDVDFSGAGLRLGISGSAPVKGPFGVTGSVSAAGLIGEQVSVTTNRIVGPIQSNSRLSRRDSRVSGNFGGELGVTFNHQMDNASTMIITIGYRAEAWLDVNDTQSEPPTFSGNIYGTMYADQIFHGPFLRGEWRFN